MTKLEKLKSNEASKGFVALPFFMIFIVLCVIFSFCPLLLDDYEFLSYNCQSIAEAINYALCYGNGRFLGNLGAILLAPHNAIAAVFKAFTVSLLCILLPKIFNATKKTTYLLSCLLILAVPEKMFAQVHAWNCGNVNYILPIIITIFCYLIIKTKDDGCLITAVKCLSIFILGFCGQLFIEHNTLVNLLISACLFLFFATKRKIYGNKKCIISFFWSAATAVGTVAMLLIPKYFIGERTRDMSKYRNFGIGSFDELCNTIIDNSAEISEHFSGNFFLILMIAVISYCLLKNYSSESKPVSLLIGFLKAVTLICVSFDLVYCLLLKNLEIGLSMQRVLMLKLKLIICVVCVLEILTFFISCFLCLKGRLRIISIIGAMIYISSITPLLIINPIGERTSFLSTVILISLTIYIYSEFVQKKIIIRNFKQRLVLISLILATIYCLFVSFIYINGCSKNIDRHIESEMKRGATVIEIFKIPNNYCHFNELMLEYKYYYKEYGDIEFKVISFEEWRENRITEGQDELWQQ